MFETKIRAEYVLVIVVSLVVSFVTVAEEHTNKKANAERGFREKHLEYALENFPAPKPEEVKRLVDLLGSPDFWTRERAQKDLLGLGTGLLNSPEFAQHGLKSSDLEIALRSESIRNTLFYPYAPVSQWELVACLTTIARNEGAVERTSEFLKDVNSRLNVEKQNALVKKSKALDELDAKNTKEFYEGNFERAAEFGKAYRDGFDELLSDYRKLFEQMGYKVEATGSSSRTLSKNVDGTERWEDTPTSITFSLEKGGIEIRVTVFPGFQNSKHLSIEVPVVQRHRYFFGLVTTESEETQSPIDLFYRKCFPKKKLPLGALLPPGIKPGSFLKTQIGRKINWKPNADVLKIGLTIMTENPNGSVNFTNTNGPFVEEIAKAYFEPNESIHSEIEWHYAMGKYILPIGDESLIPLNKPKLKH